MQGGSVVWRDFSRPHHRLHRDRPACQRDGRWRPQWLSWNSPVLLLLVGLKVSSGPDACGYDFRRRSLLGSFLGSLSTRAAALRRSLSFARATSWFFHSSRSRGIPWLEN